LIVSLVAATAAAELESARLFAEYVAKFGKNYPTMQEYQFRYIEFAKTYAQILKHNMVKDKTSTVGLNKFADWTEEERKQLRSFGGREYASLTEIELDASDLPKEINWVQKGAVNAVQDQGQCGSCWAFSAIAQMEGQHFIQTGELLKLSEQQCVDCDDESFGCSGGWQDNCMYYVQDNGGISLEEDYPYTAGTDACFAPWFGPVNVKEVYHVKSYSESQLMAAIAQGPVSVTIDADATVFHAYTSGVISGTACGSKLDHAVVAVGYGTDEVTGLDYYLVRNSWGKAWGDEGYVKIAREGDGYGVCGI